MSQSFIVVALDGSGHSLEALSAARDLAKAMGRELHGLYVYPWTQEASVIFKRESRGSGAELHQTRDQSAGEVFDEAELALGASGVLVKRHVLLGEPAEEILAFLQANPGAHLVMGRRGLSKIKSLLMGSVSDKVTRHAAGLVTVVG